MGALEPRPHRDVDRRIRSLAIALIRLGNVTG